MRLSLFEHCFLCFNLKRDASPVATWDWKKQGLKLTKVSISSEMPAPWRRQETNAQQAYLTTFQSQAIGQPRGDLVLSNSAMVNYLFQSQARCQPRGDETSYVSYTCHCLVQTQGR